jgi:hypothetical protein
VPGNFPAIHPAAKPDVRHHQLVFVAMGLKQGHGLFAGWRDGRVKSAIREGFFNKHLDCFVVFDDKYGRRVLVQRSFSAPAKPSVLSHATSIGPPSPNALSSQPTFPLLDISSAASVALFLVWGTVAVPVASARHSAITSAGINAITSQMPSGTMTRSSR